MFGNDIDSFIHMFRFGAPGTNPWRRCTRLAVPAFAGVRRSVSLYEEAS
jgi:hypothetical protein